MKKKQPAVLLFAGQGNPTIGMGSDLWNLNAVTRQVWDCASDISGTDIRRLCLKGPMNRLVQTSHQQVAVTAINVSLFLLCKERLADFDIVGSCGHSVGEYSALYAANAISLETLFRLIHFRSRLMDELSKQNKGAMLAVKSVNFTRLSELIADSGLELDISCDNSHRQQVIGGTHAALRDFAQQLALLGYESTKLGVSGAWHTRMMADGVETMHRFLADYPFSPPEHGVLMNVTAATESEGSAIRRNLAQHLTHTVKWTASMDIFLNNAKPLQFIEISNKQYLNHILKDFDNFMPERAVHCRSLLMSGGAL